MHTLLERDQQLASLLETIEGCKRGRGGVILISGEAGIGKTTLLAAAHEQLDNDHEVHWTGCDPLFNPKPLGPLYDLRGDIGDKVMPVLRQSSDQNEVFKACLNALDRSKINNFLIIEDVHWADNATIDFIKYLARRVQFISCVMCLTFRTDEVVPTHPLYSALEVLPHAHTTRIALEPLSAGAVALLADQAGQTSDNLYDITQGNPFFVTELLSDPASDATDLPSSIQDAVNARINRLVAMEASFLETISLLPTGASPAILSALFPGHGETLAMACVARGLLIIDTSHEFRFRHELARLATKTRIPTHQQPARHAIIFKALETQTDVELGTFVYHAVESQNSQAVLLYASQAAKQASLQGAHKEATSYLATALKFVDAADTQTAAQLYEDWAYESGLSQSISNEVIEARKLAITLWRAQQRPDKVGENLRWLSRLHWYRGEATAANRYADAAIDTLESCPPSSERAMAYSFRSQLDMLNDRMSDAIYWGEKALEMETQQNNIEVRIHAMTNIGSAQVMRGNEEGKTLLLSSLELALAHGFHEHAARVYTNLSDYAMRYHHLEFGEHIISEGIAFDIQHELDSWTYYLVGIQAQLRLEQGRLLDAESIALGVLGLSHQTKLMKLPASLVLARAQLRRGQPDAKKSRKEALAVANEVGEPQYSVPARLSFIEAAYLEDNTSEAFEHLEQLATQADSMLDNWRAELALWCHRFNFSLANPATLPASIELEIKGDADQAAKRWLDMGMPIHAAHAWLAQASPTLQQITSASEIIQSCQAHGLQGKLAHHANRLNAPALITKNKRGPYNASRQHPCGLTAKEQQVFAMVLQGCSNRQIADTLSRSARTIENHVSSILSKLNVHSRMDAVLRVQSEPWLEPKQRS
ncbi:helix-turn-helix transcriptional regulator [Arenicella xantha]|uniref:LuxR family transcriptional regulator n=1 Tax=Arenicella xantha TaxID=644221 RepID=A0A395JKN4_9GAMM|nr:AAA family ATPase [Arenicella xantha]RBP51129.1 LuxR family transcriptional regulator [Arenicella xantha]